MSTRLHDEAASGRRGELASLAAVRARLLAGLSPVAPATMAPAAALGLTLAADASAPADVPTAAVALADGLAVRALDTVGAGPYSPAPLPREPVRVVAGDALPAGCDAVLPADAVEWTGPLAAALVAATPGEATRRAGEDVRGGAVLAAAGTRLSALAVAALEAAGVATVAVRAPRVGLGARRAGAAAGLMDRLVAAAGGTPCEADADADLIVRIGAPGAGFAALHDGVALRPGGEDLLVGHVGGIPAVRVRDRPEAVLAAWVALVAPALAALAGGTAASMSAVVTGKVASAPGWCDLVLLRRDGPAPGAFEVLAVGDAPLSRLAAATAAGLVAEESEGLPPGDELPVLAL